MLKIKNDTEFLKECNEKRKKIGQQMNDFYISSLVLYLKRRMGYISRDMKLQQLIKLIQETYISEKRKSQEPKIKQ